ncbi:hypothetical protein BGZ46_010437 [Entomortierella lignicola]|nr:hypothetical protein BGZ46_010437 [Entomortierella lignicola]
MTTASRSRTQPQSLAQRLSMASVTQSESEAEDKDRTPRPQYQTIGLKSSSETLRVKKLADAAKNSTNTPNSPSPTVVSNTKSNTKEPSSKTAEVTDSSVSSKFGLSNKKKKQQREEQRQEERRLKEEANEALRKKHGEYHPPGHSQGQVHTHKSPAHHDHHQLERQRSSGSVRFQYQQKPRSQSSFRVASPTPMSAITPISPSPSPTPSSASSVYSSHRSGSSWGRSRPTSPTFGMTSILTNQHSRKNTDDLNDLDAEGMLSEDWNSDSDSNSSSDSEDSEDVDGQGYNRRPALVSNGYSRKKDHNRKASVDTNSSFRSNSSTVHFDLRPLSPCSAASSSRSRKKKHPNRSTLSVDKHNYPAIAQQINSDLNTPDPEEDDDLEMREIGKPGRHHSWQHNNKSTIGIVSGLSPEFEEPPRPHTSMSRYHTRSKSGDNMTERYLYHARANSPANSNVPSSSSNHRPHSRHRHHHSHQLDHYGFNDMNDLDASAMDAMRSKAGSRAAGTIRGDTTITGSGETSTYGADQPTDEHNYLAPLPPFQQGPAYTKVPKRKYCKWFCGGCRWWGLLLLFLILAGIIAAAAVLLVQKFKKCVAIDPATVNPIIYAIDPSSISSISLEYQTQTQGTINIVDSPNVTETRVLLKLQRQFYGMESQVDITGFQINNLQNGTVQYVLNDMANSNRGFFKPTVLCSNSILTVEMPRALQNRSELSFDVLVDQQDIYVNLNESIRRSSTWGFKGISNQKLVIQSLNVNALSISYSSTSPSTVTLSSVIVRDQLSVTSVSGDIQASVGFSSPLTPSTSLSAPPSTPATVNLNTLDGYVQFDMQAWNQTCSFLVNSPSVQVSISKYVVLPFGYHNSTGINLSGLVANSSSNGVSGSFSPARLRNSTLTSTTSSPLGTATSTYTKTTTSSTRTGTVTTTPTASSTPVAPSGPTLGAGGSNLAAQINIQANKYAILNFP